MCGNKFAHEAADFACSTGIELLAKLDERSALGLLDTQDKLTPFILFFSRGFMFGHGFPNLYIHFI